MMPVKKPKPVVAFRFVGAQAMVVDGFGVLEPNQIVPLGKAKEVFGAEFNGSDVLVPVEEETPNENVGGDN